MGIGFGDIVSGLLGTGAQIYSANQQARNVEKSNATNVYLSGQQMEWQSKEADINREFEANQAKIASAVSAEEASKTRDFTSEQARRSMEFSASEARQQQDFQERMSNTSYQRAVEDMKKAGINPMFAITQGGASSPGGAAGSGAQGGGASGSGYMAGGSMPSGRAAEVVPVPSVVSNVISGAMDMMRTYGSLKQAMSSSRLADAQTIKTGVETKKLGFTLPEKDLESRFFGLINRILDIGHFSWGAVNRGAKATHDYISDSAVPFTADFLGNKTFK